MSSLKKLIINQLIYVLTNSTFKEVDKFIKYVPLNQFNVVFDSFKYVYICMCVCLCVCV